MTYGTPSGPTTSEVRFAFGTDFSKLNIRLEATVITL